MSLSTRISNVFRRPARGAETCKALTTNRAGGSRRTKRVLRVESLERRELLAAIGIGNVGAMLNEQYRDFDFKVAGSFSGTSVIPGVYSDRFQGTLSNAVGTATFTSPTLGTVNGTGTANISGVANGESYAYSLAASGNGTIDDGALKNISFVPNAAPGLNISGTFNPLTWETRVSFSGVTQGADTSGNFRGNVSQSLDKTDFAASVKFDTAAADAIHDDRHSVEEIAAKVKAIVTIDVSGQHMRAASMGSVVTTANIYMGQSPTGIALTTPIPIHWNTGRIVVVLDNFLANKSDDGKLHIVFDEKNLVPEANENNNDVAVAIPYDIEAKGLGWLKDGSVLGSYRVGVMGFSGQPFGSNVTAIYFADKFGKILDYDPSTPTILDSVSVKIDSGLSHATATTGDFLIFSPPLSTRPAGATQLVMLTNNFVPGNRDTNLQNNQATLPLTELTATSIQRNVDRSATVHFSIGKAALAFDTTATVYWAKVVGKAVTPLGNIATFPLNKGQFGAVAMSTPTLTVPPVGANRIIVDIDPTSSSKPMGIILEPNENNSIVLNRAITSLALSSASIDENKPIKTVIGKLTAVDGDKNEKFTYRLVSGAGASDNLKFKVVGNSLNSAAIFDFETKSSYSIRLRATDSFGFTFDRIVLITINNINDPT